MTTQIREKVIFDNEERFIYLVHYKTTTLAYPEIPENHPEIIEIKDTSVLEGNELNNIVFSTACYRRYLGTWEIKDGMFYLINLIGKIKLRKQKPIFASWFTGTIQIPKGEKIGSDRIHGPIYEQEIHIEIESGIVLKIRTIDNDRDLFVKKTDSYSVQSNKKGCLGTTFSLITFCFFLIIFFSL
jgi:hypothetical protein